MGLEKEIEIIKERNWRVDNNKAWEISFTRKLFIAGSTYVVAGIWLVVTHDTTPWLKSLVPAAGYMLSTLSLPYVKNWWIDRHRKPSE